MITCKFTDDGFTISGHSGYSESGSDIVCSAVSAMTMLICNTITEQFGINADISSDEKKAKVSLKLKNTDHNDNAKSLITGFRNELVSLMQEYPDNIKVL